VISDSKIARFYAIAREAVEQCGGLTMPEIVFVSDNSGLPAYGEMNIVLDTIGSQRSLREFLDIQNVGIWV